MLHATQRQLHFLKKALKNYENKNLKRNTKNTTDKMSTSDGIKKWEREAYHSKTKWKRTVVKKKEKASAVVLS